MDPERVLNNDILDFISRVPDNKILVNLLFYTVIIVVPNTHCCIDYNSSFVIFFCYLDRELHWAFKRSIFKIGKL